MALEFPQNGWRASLRKRGMQGIKMQPLSWQEQDQGSPRSSSSCSLHQSCHKCLWQKKTLWPPGSYLAPSYRPPHSTPKLYIIQPPLPFNTYTSLALYIPKRPLYQSNSAQATNWFFSALHDFPSALGLQMGSPWLCSRLLLESWSLPFTSSLPCLCTLV